MTTPKKPRGRNGGRKKIGDDRGGLVPLMVQIFADQAEKLRERGNQSVIVRVCLDKFFEESKKNKSLPAAKDDDKI